MGDRITKVRPGPTNCPLAGRDYPVHEATIGGLLALQSWVDFRWPEPLEGLDAELEGKTGVDRDRVLFDAYDRASEGAPCFDEAGGSVLLCGTPDGISEFLRVALSRGNPTLGPTEYRELAGLIESGAGLDWFRAVQKAFYGIDPTRRVVALLGAEGRRTAGEPLSWGEAIDDLARSHGWTYETIYGLTVTEFLNARRGGKPRDSGFAGLSPAETEALRKRVAAVRGWPD